MGASGPNWGLWGAAHLPVICSVKALHSWWSGPSAKPPYAYVTGFDKLASARIHQFLPRRGKAAVQITEMLTRQKHLTLVCLRWQRKPEKTSIGALLSR